MWLSLRRLLVATGVLVASGCQMSVRTNNALSVPTLTLAEADYTVLDWVESKSCATYVFFFRAPEQEGNERSGVRKGTISKGSVLGGGGASDPDSVDALYGALIKMPDATHLLNPIYTVHANGFLAGLLGRPMFGRRCARVRARGLAVGTGPYDKPSRP